MDRSGHSNKPRFLKPRDDDGDVNSWEEDKPDINPITATTFVYNPYMSISLDRQRQRLPIYKSRDHIIYLLEKYQTLVLVGETGSGKSTQVPQYLLEAGWGDDGKLIGITQPRRVAVTSLASRVADELGSLLGEEVGYSIRFDEKFSATSTRIKYMTEGLLIREMMSDPLLRQYAVLILDEVHERTLNCDVLMGLLRKVLKKRRDLKLIVSSATVDAEELQQFFNLKASSSKTDSAVALSISGRAYPVEVSYAANPVPDYVQDSVNTVTKIHESEGDGDILVFLTGQDEVDRAITLLNQHAQAYSDRRQKNTLPELYPLPMYGSLPPRDQLKVFQRTPEGKRKVVVSTNIAETSVTIHGVVFVVDCGFVKMKWYNPGTFTDSLVVLPISKASAEQRAGRAGRTRPGKVFRLYPESEYDKLAVAPVPEIQRSDLALVILNMKVLGVENIVRFRFPASPPSKHLIAGVELLCALGALDGRGQLTSPLGEQLAEFPLNPCLSKMLLSSGEFGCSEEITTIVGMLEVENVFQTPWGNAGIKARVAKRQFEVGEGDLITLLNVHTAFLKNGSSKQFCGQNFLHYKRIKRAIQLKDQMVKMLKRFKVPVVSADGNLDAVLRCITSGLFPNAVYLHHSGIHRTVRGDLPVYVHPSSLLYTEPQPQWILFTEIIHTTKVFMRELTVVKPEWLEELAPQFYKKSTERFYS